MQRNFRHLTQQRQSFVVASLALLSARRGFLEPPARGSALGKSNPHVGLQTSGARGGAGSPASAQRRHSHIFDPAILRAAQKEKDLRANAVMREVEENFDQDEIAKQNSRAHIFAGAGAAQYDSATRAGSSPTVEAAEFARERELYELRQRREEVQRQREKAEQDGGDASDPPSRFLEEVQKMREAGTAPPWARFRSPQELFMPSTTVPKTDGDTGSNSAASSAARVAQARPMSGRPLVDGADVMQQRKQEIDRRLMDRARRHAQDKLAAKMTTTDAVGKERGPTLQQQEERMNLGSVEHDPLDGGAPRSGSVEHEALPPPLDPAVIAEALDPAANLTEQERRQIELERTVRERRAELKPGPNDGAKRDPKQEFVSRVGFGEVDDVEQGGVTGWDKGTAAEQAKREFEEELRRRRSEERRKRMIMRKERNLERQSTAVLSAIDAAGAAPTEAAAALSEADVRAAQMAASVQKRLKLEREKAAWEEEKREKGLKERDLYEAEKREEEEAEAERARRLKQQQQQQQRYAEEGEEVLDDGVSRTASSLEHQQTLSAKESPFGTRRQQLRHIELRGPDGKGDAQIHVHNRWVGRSAAQELAVNVKPAGPDFYTAKKGDDPTPFVDRESKLGSSSTDTSSAKPLPLLIVTIADPTLPWRMFKKELRLRKWRKMLEDEEGDPTQVEEKLLAQVKDEMAILREKKKMSKIIKPIRKTATTAPPQHVVDAAAAAVGGETENTNADSGAASSSPPSTRDEEAAAASEVELEKEARRRVLLAQKRQRFLEMQKKAVEEDRIGGIAEEDTEYYMRGDQQKINDQILAQAAANCIVSVFFLVFLSAMVGPFG